MSELLLFSVNFSNFPAIILLDSMGKESSDSNYKQTDEIPMS